MHPGSHTPPGYSPALTPQETERAIRLIKEFFQTNLAFELNLMRVTAPIIVRAGTGINDDLNGIEKPVSFLIKGLDGERVEIVQSLAKWKRMALAQLGIAHGHGLYADMNAIRPDEILDSLHSLYVDQWDWERVISGEERNVEFLKVIVRKIYDVVRRTERYIAYQYEPITPILPDTIAFVHSEELQARYPELTPREREYEICREHGAVFIIGIGSVLSDGVAHDGRAPDYDDWSTPSGNGFRGLNGDILVYYPFLDCAFELSSMGIRVDADGLLRQLEIRQVLERRDLLFHRRLLSGELPLSIGGGIGQSRLCMLYLRKAHIGEIQASIWPEEMVHECARNDIFLL
jgi:aspartate--ammonia ligase